VVKSPRRKLAGVSRRLRDSNQAFATAQRNPTLRRALLAFGFAWTAEWAFPVALGVVAFRNGGATAVGVVAFARMAPDTNRDAQSGFPVYVQLTIGACTRAPIFLA
jgi:hypothetical protein